MVSEVKQSGHAFISYSFADKNFTKNVETKAIPKGMVSKAKAKTSLTKLRKEKTYYFRARLIDKEGLGSNWSKVVKAKTKK